MISLRIGILTHHYIKNYGAFLQAYSLQETLKILYPNDEVCIINYVIKRHQFINTCGWFRFNPRKDNVKSYFQKIKIPIIFSKFEKKYLNVTKKVNSIKQINNLNFDAIIIGSDEVWNYEDRKSYNPLKFGYGLACKNIITYAPSIGKSKLKNAPEEIIKGLSNIKSFSSREDGAEKLIKKFTQKKCTRVLDPTFLYDFPDYSSKLVDKMKKNKYILLYYCDNLSDSFKEQVIEYARKHDLKIYGAGEYQKWFDYFPVNINPFEWVEMFRNAEIIFTGTFHGTVFSIKSEKQFYNCLGNPSRINKVNSLLNELEIGNRQFYLKNSKKSAIDYKNVNKILSVKREQSLSFLKMLK